MNTTTFQDVLDTLKNKLTAECKIKPWKTSDEFEQRVRELLSKILAPYDLKVNFHPHPQIFPDIVLGKYGIEIKFTTNDTWRSVANSVFESTRSEEVEHIYILFGKMGGEPAVDWGLYEDCVMHVRTSHVPRFEVEINAKESLFKKFKISYAEFCKLSIEDRMKYVRTYARSRLKRGERLWWLDNEPNNAVHSLPLQVKLYSNLEMEEKLKLRAEASLLCPQIVGSSRNRTKYSDPIMYALTYHGVLCTRDAFSAGSAAGPERGGIYVMRALQNIQKQMRQAAAYLDDALFVEYWGKSVPAGNRIKEWLRLADKHAQQSKPPWKPSQVLFLVH